jgi:hypothetical protein
MKKILLTNGGFTLVDDEDCPLVAGYAWYWIRVPNSDLKYAVRNATTKEKQQRGSIRLHRQLLGLAHRTPHVDHRDRNGLNNTRGNLRICTPHFNACNRKTRKDSVSGYKGVGRRPSGKWRAVIFVSNTRKHLGDFSTSKDAARAYNQAARKYFGEFARPNILLP